MKIKPYLARFISRYSPTVFFKIAYLHNRRKLPNFKNPKDLSEIWIKKTLQGDNIRNYTLADKYEVRDYVKSLGLEEILVPLIGVWENAEDIDFSIFPDKFAIKMNYGAGMNIIVTDRNKLNQDTVRFQLKEWMTKNKVYSNSEAHYNLIKRRIIAEEFIDDGNGGFPCDYKFMCIHGKVHCILAVYGRETTHGEYLPYSCDWKPLYHYAKDMATKLVDRPQNLGKMISVAEKLAKNFDLVRVDLYSNGNKIWFGEMTLTPAGCIFHNWTQAALNEMGEVYRNHKIKNGD